jgi:hypothetical protein
MSDRSQVAAGLPEVDGCETGDVGLQFVLVDDDDPDEVLDVVSRVFEPTAEDRKTMLDCLNHLGEMPTGYSLRVAAVPW